MLQQKEQTAAIKENDLLITRVIDAPRELVFSIWTDAGHLEKWNAPTGCTLHYKKIDIMPGGEFHSVVHNPDYPDCWVKGVYLEIVKPERIVYVVEMTDEAGNSNLPQFQNSEWPASMIVSVSFEEAPGNKTKLILRQSVSEAAARNKGAYQGWISSFDILEKYLLSL